jgi:hypothetical protein
VIAAGPHPTPLRGATLPASGRDWRTQIRVDTETPMQFLVFQVSRKADAVPSLPFTGSAAREARRVGFNP